MLRFSFHVSLGECRSLSRHVAAWTRGLCELANTELCFCCCSSQTKSLRIQTLHMLRTLGLAAEINPKRHSTANNTSYLFASETFRLCRMWQPNSSTQDSQHKSLISNLAGSRHPFEAWTPHADLDALDFGAQGQWCQKPTVANDLQQSRHLQNEVSVSGFQTPLLACLSTQEPGIWGLCAIGCRGSCCSQVR